MSIRALLLLFIACALPQAATAGQYCQAVVVGHTAGDDFNAPQPIHQQQCSWLAGAIAFDPKERVFASTWNDSDPNRALNSVMASCGQQCAGLSFYENHAYVAISDDDTVYGTSTSSPAAASLDCLRRGGLVCDAVIIASSTGSAEYWKFGALAYDAKSGAVGSSVSRFRRGDAEREALEGCGVATCHAFSFQRGYAALALSSDGQVFGANADRDGRAAKDARKACKEATGDKNCRVVATGAALDAGDRRDRAERYLERRLEGN